MANERKQSSSSSSSRTRTRSGCSGNENEVQSRPPIQCLHSFDESHLTRPSPSRRPRPSYTAQQKAEAVRLLNEGTPAKVIAQQLGASCNTANVYRWRAQQRELEARREAERRERRLRRQRACQQWIRALIRPLAFIWAHRGLLLPLLCATAEIIGFTFCMEIRLQMVWGLSRLALMGSMLYLGLPPRIALWIYKTTVICFWIYLAYCCGIYLSEIVIDPFCLV